jgi:hypothetical protein
VLTAILQESEDLPEFLAAESSEQQEDQLEELFAKLNSLALARDQLKQYG